MAYPQPIHLRAAAPHGSRPDGHRLGLLADLPGTWVGNGFNLVSLPDFQNGKIFRVDARATKETLTFTAIGGKIPNRGAVQDDIFFLGLHYLQQVSDALTNDGMHIEPGLWLNMPSPTPGVDNTDPVNRLLVRQAAIPHGDSLLALSTTLIDVSGGPTIAVENTSPIKADGTLFASNDPYLQPFKDATQTLPACPPIDPTAIQNPNVVLQAAIKGQNIVNTKVIVISTIPATPATTPAPPVPGTPTAGILNVPFVVKNANAISMTAIFWIETVLSPTGDPFLQLQYTQRVLLSFANIQWPHISVATLIQQ